MNLLHRHIFNSVAFTCGAAVGLFAFVLMLGNFIRDMLSHVVAGQIELGMSAELIFWLLVSAIPYALPMGILTGVLLVLGRMSAENEVTAMRAAGLGLVRIATPIFFFALLGVTVAVASNFYYMPRAKVKYEQELRRAVKNNPMSFIVQKTFIRDFPGVVFYVGEIHGDVMKDFWLWELDSQARVKRFVRAQQGGFSFEEDSNTLILTLVHAQVESRDENQPENFIEAPPAISFDKTSVKLPLDNILGNQSFRQKLDWMTFGELVAEWKRLGAPVADKKETERAKDRMKVQIAIHSKFSMAFSILSFALIGVPLGIKVSRKETSANLVIALALALGYYFLTVIVGWMDKHPDLRPDLLMWVPNIIFQTLGAWMFWKTDRQ
ncbi:MAG TPA: LptF/LptG family permease [Opitutaceae bacterium]|nr:LptF/LptG family permease [Opitutaceae bacterium]